MRPMRCIYARCGVFAGMASSCRRAPCARQGAGTRGVMFFAGMSSSCRRTPCVRCAVFTRGVVFSLAWPAPVGGRHASDALHLRAVRCFRWHGQLL